MNYRQPSPRYQRYLLALAALGGAALSAAAASQEPIKVYAAGSLAGALTAAAKLYTAQTGQAVETVFGPAGALRDRLERGEQADVFASANMAHPQALAQRGLATPPVVMLRNRICAQALPAFGLTSDNLLERMLDPKVGIMTSTPKSDPGGDYAWLLFAKAGTLRPGAQQVLEAKAQQLVGGAHDAPIPPGQSALQYYAGLGKVQMSIGYCSSRKTTPDPSVTVVEMPPGLALSADYGLTVLTGKKPVKEGAYRFALFMLTPQAQKAMAEYGFVPTAQTSGL